ncbi:MAG: DUF2059 domain-containing protein [Dongiaceae bacterium]
MTKFLSLLSLLAFLAAAPAEAASADAQSLADARALIQALHIGGVRDQIVNGTLRASYQRMMQANKGKDAAVKSFAEQSVLPVLRARQNDITEQQARLLAQHFTGDELRQLVAFYKSPLGAKLVANFPVVLGEMQQYANQWANAVLNEAQPKLAAEAKKRGLAMPGS